jgi:hypothetical protein
LYELRLNFMCWFYKRVVVAIANFPSRSHT